MLPKLKDVITNKNLPELKGLIMNMLPKLKDFSTNMMLLFVAFAGVDARYVQSSEFPDKRTLLLTDLKPWAGHQFRVRAINQYGVGDPSIPTCELFPRDSVSYAVVQTSCGMEG